MPWMWPQPPRQQKIPPSPATGLQVAPCLPHPGCRLLFLFCCFLTAFRGCYPKPLLISKIKNIITSLLSVKKNPTYANSCQWGGFFCFIGMCVHFMNAYKPHFSSQVPIPREAGHNFSQMSSNLHFLPIAALILKVNRGFYEIFEHNGDKNRQSTGCSSGLLCRRAWSCYLSLDPHCFLTSPLQGQMYP